MAREWAVTGPVEVSDALRQAVGGHPLLARLLTLRGLGAPDTALAYLDPERYTPSATTDLPDCAEAAVALRETIAAGGRIRVWGDFDADGETSTAVLFEALTALGGRVDYCLPERHEGHGLSARALTDAQRDGVALLITCDTGIEAAEVVRAHAGTKLAIVITDHHDLPAELPPARAVVNPKRLPKGHPARELSGVGVAYVLARQLLEGSPAGQRVLADLLDVVAIGLVADVAALVGDVRYYVQHGLRALRVSARPGLRALFALAGLDARNVDEGTIGYQIGPRLNAAGRLDDASLGVRLLLTRDATEATAIAQQLEVINADRQARTDALTTVVEAQLRASPEMLSAPAIVLEGENWEGGVLGLVAGKLAHDYGRPVVLIAHAEGRDSAASARSVPGIDVHAAIASQSALLVREGGHPMAAGFAIRREQVARFRRGLLEHVAQQAAGRVDVPPLAVDAELPWSELSIELARDLARLAPFGQGNPRPILAAQGGVLVRAEDVSRKRETSHRRLYLSSDSGATARITWFNAGTLPPTGEPIDVALQVGLSSQRGEERLDLVLVDWRPAATRIAREVAGLVAGREVVDLRAEGDWRQLLAGLQRKHPGALAIFAEGLDVPLAGIQPRTELAGSRAAALVLLTAPPEPAVLRELLAATEARLVYLLPPHIPVESGAGAFVRSVAGMVRVAIDERDGVLDITRMASRLAGREAAIVAALRGLEAAGSVLLEQDVVGLKALVVMRDADQRESQRPADGLSAEQRVAADQARSALVHVLSETAAYRRFYATASVAEIFASP
ncbi:MAG: single-stranded-DNA-specific exonuclease RecJ [Chloroflexi bacterium]|nr:single-stranded-DNA-specific exonuclease RecJ [Chloroflexota bacterium]